MHDRRQPKRLGWSQAETIQRIFTVLKVTSVIILVLQKDQRRRLGLIVVMVVSWDSLRLMRLRRKTTHICVCGHH